MVLIPFINETRLLDAMRDPLTLMAADEKARNSHGPMSIFTHSPDDLGPYQAPAYFPEIGVNHALLTPVWREEWEVAVDKLKHGLMAGVKLDVFFPGFPTLAHIPHVAKVKASGVRVFEQVWLSFRL